jgi:hypothetical protein
MSAERNPVAPGETVCVEIGGKKIPHNSDRWSVRTNRHLSTDGRQWGWIEGAPGNVCWEDRREFDRNAASLACLEHNTWLEDVKPVQLKINEARDAWASAKTALDKAESELSLRQAAFKEADDTLASLIAPQGAASHG